VTAFERAIELEPPLAAAHLRLSLQNLLVNGDYSIEDAREQLRLAMALRSALGAHDAQLLSAIEPCFRQPAEPAESETRLTAAIAAAPDDPEFPLWLAVVRSVRDTKGAIEAVDAALKIDPAFGAGLYVKGWLLAVAGKNDDALAAFDACIAAAPTATNCLRARVTLEEAAGQCAKAEADDHRLIAGESNEAVWYRRLARALYSNGRSMEAVEDALKRMAERWPEKERAKNTLWQGGIQLAELKGDFVLAEKKIGELASLVAASPSAGDHMGVEFLLMDLYLEEGRTIEAARVAQDAENKLGAWTPSPSGGDYTMNLANVLRVAGKMRPEERAAKREAWLKTNYDLIVAHSISFFGDGGPGDVWLEVYADGVLTPDEAKEALDALPKYEPLPQRPFLVAGDGFNLGKTYLLGGRVDDAVAALERATRSCTALEYPLAHTMAFELLGRALEKKGDSAGACAAYKVVIDRWGSAKPKSTTADRARARYKALACR
jgi:eukaryotic-like serine/threonine-protein kinase